MSEETRAEPAPPPAQHKGCLIVPLLAVAAGLFLTYFYTVRPMMQIDEASGWVETAAEVIESKVVEAHSSRSFDYEPYVVYSYTFEGEPHESHRLAFASLMKPEKRGAREIAARYPKGAKITCWVNPDDPSQAVVMRDREQDLRLKLIGPMLIVVSFVFFFLVRKRQKQHA